MMQKRRRTKYTQMSDHCLVRIDKLFKTECCDCSLVHLWKVVVKRGVVYFEIKRDNRATAQRRRHRSKP